MGWDKTSDPAQREATTTGSDFIRPASLITCLLSLGRKRTSESALREPTAVGRKLDMFDAYITCILSLGRDRTGTPAQRESTAVECELTCHEEGSCHTLNHSTRLESQHEHYGSIGND